MTETKETFSCTVVSETYHEAHVRAWEALQAYLGTGISRDTSRNWNLAEMHHGEHPEKPNTLVTMAKFERISDDPPETGGGIATYEVEPGFWEE